MPQQASAYQLLGMAFLVLVTAAWGIGLVLLVRRGRLRAASAQIAPARETAALTPPVRPGDRVGPRRESVALSPAERREFAGLVRRLGAGH
jgi:hypothetical protein